MSFQGKTTSAYVQIKFNCVYAQSKLIYLFSTTPFLTVRLIWRRPSTCSYWDAKSYQKILAMGIEILSRNYGQICQILLKYFSILRYQIILVGLQRFHLD